MKIEFKKKMLKAVAGLGRKAAESGCNIPSFFCTYQPETPEALKKLMEKK